MKVINFLILRGLFLIQIILVFSVPSSAQEIPDSFYDRNRKMRTVSEREQNISCRAICLHTVEDTNNGKPIYILHSDIMLQANSKDEGLEALRKECQGDNEKLVSSFEKAIIKVEAVKQNTKKVSKKKSISASANGDEYVISSAEATIDSCGLKNLNREIEQDQNSDSTVLEAQ